MVSAGERAAFFPAHGRFLPATRINNGRFKADADRAPTHVRARAGTVTRRESKTVLCENSEETSETTQPVAPDRPASPPVVSQSCPNPERSPKRHAAFHADLAEALRVGDLAAARAAHEALGRQLGGDGEPAELVDLAVARAKRARS